MVDRQTQPSAMLVEAMSLDDTYDEQEIEKVLLFHHMAASSHGPHAVPAVHVDGFIKPCAFTSKAVHCS